jgi:leucine dehydrogenase
MDNGIKNYVAQIPGFTTAQIQDSNKDWHFAAVYSTPGTTKTRPALGGCRRTIYSDDEAVKRDAQRLANGMGHKANWNYDSRFEGPNLSGGKLVVNAVGNTCDPTLMHNIGKFVQRMNGAYITAEDSGTSTHDMRMIHKETEYVVGLSRRRDGRVGSGDPSPATALGVYEAIKASLNVHELPLEGRKYALRGAAGNVALSLLLGFPSGHQSETQKYASYMDTLPGLIHSAHKIYCSDIHVHLLERIRTEAQQRGLIDLFEKKIEFVEGDQIYDKEVDVFIPCARGKSASRARLEQMSGRVKIVCGPENNPHDNPDTTAREYANRNITVVPHFVANGGGLINVWHEILAQRAERDFNVDDSLDHILGIGPKVYNLLSIASSTGRTPRKLAIESANELRERISPSLGEEIQ